MAVQLTHINKSFGRQPVLRDVTLTIPDGQILGLLGPNGAGKSTLMKILIGLWRADSGEVKAPLRIGYLPENNPLYDEMYVAEYLRFMAQMTNDPYGASRSEELPITNVDALIDRVGLTPERHKHIRELSKGYRQRVGLAQALLGDPELIILDEPTTGLDPNQLVEIRALIRDITKPPLTKNEVNRALAAENDQSPMTKSPIVILSTHIMQEVREMCDRVVILNHGEIKADKMIDEITDLEQLFHDSTDSNKSFVL